ncbi:MAG: hypothetical protein GY870_02835 [archaeon]|nr:hypothetical protein [archaeon]
MQTSRILDEVAEKVSRILEREGYLTTPISADKPAEIHLRDPDTGKKLKHVKTISHLSFKHAAQGIGMGEIGLNNLLLTPEFGPHQRLSGIITEAPLEPDPPKKIKMCDNCKKCEKACPVGALKDGEYNVDPCFDFWGTGLTKPMPRNFFEILKRTPYLLKHKKRRHLITEIMQIAITDVDFCIECMRACPKGSAWEKIRPKLEFPKKTSIF